MHAVHADVAHELVRCHVVAVGWYVFAQGIVSGIRPAAMCGDLRGMPCCACSQALAFNDRGRFS
jgi:hypothetical protein